MIGHYDRTLRHFSPPDAALPGGISLPAFYKHMRLDRSAWRKQSSWTQYQDFILILPQEGAIVTFTSVPGDRDKRVIWGCWIREEDDGLVYTAVRGAEKWKRESYSLYGDHLTWKAEGEPVAWCRVAESDLSAQLHQDGQRFLLTFGGFSPPRFPQAEQSDPCV